MTSIEALMAGIDLWWHGGVEQSRAFFKISADLHTGSDSSYMAEALYAGIENRFKDAVNVYQRMIKRYDDSQAHRDLISVLVLLGKEDQAIEHLRGLDKKKYAPDIDPAIYFLSRKSDHFSYRAVFEELSDDSRLRILFFDLLISREHQSELLQQTISQYRLDSFDKGQLQTLKDSLTALAQQNFKGAFTGMSTLYDNIDNKSRHLDNIRKISLPYMGRICGKTNEEELFKKILTHVGEDNYWTCLMAANYYGVTGDKNKSLEYINKAAHDIPMTGDALIFPWYQMVESGEFLYDATGENVYKQRTLELTRLFQKIRPMVAWAYAIEYRLSPEGEEKTRALAIAEFLDPDSWRISAASRFELAEAKKWYESNRPFH